MNHTILDATRWNSADFGNNFSQVRLKLKSLDGNKDVICFEIRSYGKNSDTLDYDLIVHILK